MEDHYLKIAKAQAASTSPRFYAGSKWDFSTTTLTTFSANFFNDRAQKRTYVRQSSEEDERVMDFIETEEHVFFIIIPGCGKEDVIIKS